ncbi:MAG: hypothetical protein QM612_09090 [Thermomonas sp.]|uniref:hypothetical protein n=1 Tax=Thermomonas sp. TaxID=1971895 RepID=UPI0039E51FC0
MGRHRVPKWNNPLASVVVEDGATIGATFGVDLRWPSGALVQASDFQGAQSGAGSVTYWRTIMETPPNVTALGATNTTGLYVVTGAGTSVTRALVVDVADLTLANGNGAAGNPALALAEVPDAGGGALLKTAFDTKGRKTGSSAATTDDLAEGAANLYFTDARADARVDAFKASLPALTDAVDDAAAAVAGVAVGGMYRNGSALMIRIS